jgi:hypothetical protein
VSSRVLQRGAAFFELEYQVSSVDQWIPVFITEEPTSGRAPAFIDHGGGEYCFRMIATREGNFGDAILGTGYCGDCQ